MTSILNRYLIAVIPPEEINEQIREFQHDMAGRFQSSKALRNIPHITLKAPFQTIHEEHTKVVNWFDALQIDVQPFSVALDGFGSFSGSARPVIYVKPVANKDLSSLQNQILQAFSGTFPEIKVSHTEKVFSPHITIAYRDLTPEYFIKAWTEYTDMPFNASFQVSSFHLMQHDGNGWNTISEHRL
jgi:2'-5' RNA ligase